MLTSWLRYCLDFLFPKSQSVIFLESLSASDLLTILPKAENRDESHTVVLFDYRDPRVKEMVWELKYKHNRILASKLGQILRDVILQELSEKVMFESALWKKAPPLLIPIPTSNKRRKQRGLNPTEMLCREIRKIDQGQNFEYAPDILQKIRHTESQARIHATRQERLSNLENSMQVDPKEKRALGRCVILVDDVTTSGTTFREAERALKQGGAKKIIRFAVAR